MSEPPIYYTTEHPLECTCSGRDDVEIKKHVWSCPARCCSFEGIGHVAPVPGPHLAPTNASRCAFEIGHDGQHESYNGARW